MTLISSAADYPKKEIHAQSTSTQQEHGVDDVHPNSESKIATSKPLIPQEDTPKKIRIVKTKEQIKEQYPELFEDTGRFPGEPYHIHTNPSITPKQTPCRSIPVHLKQTFRQEIEKMLTAGVMKPVHEATPWINSLVLIESQDKSAGKPKLCIRLDPTNLNKAIIHEPYCFHTPEDIAHKLAGATVIRVLNCSKGYWYQPLDDESSFLTLSTPKLVDLDLQSCHLEQLLQVMSFNGKWDSIFLHLDNVMMIADDIMVIGYQEDELDHVIAFTKLLETTKKNNIKLNFNKIQYKQKEVDFFWQNIHNTRT